MTCEHAGNLVVCRPGPWHPATAYYVDLDVTSKRFRWPDRVYYRMWWRNSPRKPMYASCCRRKRWAAYLEIAPNPWYDHWPTRCLAGRGCNKPQPTRRKRYRFPRAVA